MLLIFLFMTGQLVFIIACLIIWFPAISSEVRMLWEEIQNFVHLRKRSVLALLILAAFFFFLTMSAIAFGITLLKSTPDVPQPKHSEVTAPEPPTNLQTLQIHLCWQAGCDATNLIVLLSPLGATNQVGRGDVSDVAGQVCFNNIPIGNYRLIAIQEGASFTRLQTSQINLGAGQKRFDYPLNMMKSPEAVYNLSAFRLNKASLRPEHLNVLDRLAANVPAGQLILVLGFADARGPANFNDRLAGERAITVHNFLFEKGVSNESLCFSMGDRKPVVPENLRGTPKNRRALCLLVSNNFNPNQPRD